MSLMVMRVLGSRGMGLRGMDTLYCCTVLLMLFAVLVSVLCFYLCTLPSFIMSGAGGGGGVGWWEENKCGGRVSASKLLCNYLVYQ